jgi:hypothetical protein
VRGDFIVDQGFAASFWVNADLISLIYTLAACYTLVLLVVAKLAASKPDVITSGGQLRSRQLPARRSYR